MTEYRIYRCIDGGFNIIGGDMDVHVDRLEITTVPTGYHVKIPGGRIFATTIRMEVD